MSGIQNYGPNKPPVLVIPQAINPQTGKPETTNLDDFKKQSQQMQQLIQSWSAAWDLKQQVSGLINSFIPSKPPSSTASSKPPGSP